jgi:hypothetical protein
MKLLILSVLILLILVSCTGNSQAIDPIERGLSYVAAAISLHAILQLFS